MSSDTKTVLLSEVIDTAFIDALLPGRDAEAIESWVAALHQDEIRTVADAALVNQSDWDKIDVPAVVHRAIMTMCKAPTPAPEPEKDKEAATGEQGKDEAPKKKAEEEPEKKKKKPAPFQRSEEQRHE